MPGLWAIQKDRLKAGLHVIAVLLFAAAVWAANEPQKDGGSKQQEEKERPAAAARRENDDEQRPRDQLWPRPFVPSEQIGADSVVSFPADI